MPFSMSGSLGVTASVRLMGCTMQRQYNKHYRHAMDIYIRHALNIAYIYIRLQKPKLMPINIYLSRNG